LPLSELNIPTRAAAGDDTEYHAAGGASAWGSSNLKGLSLELIHDLCDGDAVVKAGCNLGARAQRFLDASGPAHALHPAPAGN
jgi:hypothetical protein